MADGLRFDGRVAVVTGAGRGLGRAYAHALAARGARVVVNDLGVHLDGSSAADDPASEVVAEITRAGGAAIADHSSVATVEGGQAIVDAALEEWGRIDVLVNNAGTLADGAFHKTTPGRLHGVLDVHLAGAFYTTLPAWRVMREQGYGRVVNTTSTSGLFGNFGQSSYGAAKGGVLGLTRVLAIEGSSRNIKVNAIAPGAVTRMTPISSGLDGDALSPDLVAPVVVYLAHESCAVTGEVLRTSAGHVARIFLGLTRGHTSDQLTAEEVRDHLDDIMDPSAFHIPTSALDTAPVVM